MTNTQVKLNPPATMNLASFNTRRQFPNNNGISTNYMGMPSKDGPASNRTDFALGRRFYLDYRQPKTKAELDAIYRSRNIENIDYGFTYRVIFAGEDASNIGLGILASKIVPISEPLKKLYESPSNEWNIVTAITTGSSPVGISTLPNKSLPVGIVGSQSNNGDSQGNRYAVIDFIFSINEFYNATGYNNLSFLPSGFLIDDLSGDSIIYLGSSSDSFLNNVALNVNIFNFDLIKRTITQKLNPGKPIPQNSSDLYIQRRRMLATGRGTITSRDKDEPTQLKGGEDKNFRNQAITRLRAGGTIAPPRTASKAPGPKQQSILARKYNR